MAVHEAVLEHLKLCGHGLAHKGVKASVGPCWSRATPKGNVDMDNAMLEQPCLLKVLWPLYEATLEQVLLRALWLWMSLWHSRYILWRL